MAVFATVVRSGSFAAGARALGLTRAVVSHHIRVLENKLGVPLAQRLRLLGVRVGTLAKAEDVAALAQATAAAGTSAEESAPPPYTDQLF